MGLTRTAVTAALSAFAAMAFLGTTAATAEIVKKTVGCEANEEPCAKENIFAKGTKMKGQLTTGTEMFLETNITNITCKKGSAELETLEEKGTQTPVEAGAAYGALGKVTSSALNECKTSSGSACTVTMVNLPWSLSLEWIEPNTGIARTLSPTAGGKVVCGFLINCTFTTPEATETVTGGVNAMKTIEEVELVRSGGFCPAEARMNGSGELLEPSPIYISYVEEEL